MQADDAAEGAGWLHELKLDGYRIQARKDGEQGSTADADRVGLDASDEDDCCAVGRLPVEKATLDGEVVVLAQNGTTSFADLQAAFQEGVKKPLSYFVFDLLHLNGHNCVVCRWSSEGAAGDAVGRQRGVFALERAS